MVDRDVGKSSYAHSKKTKSKTWLLEENRKFSTHTRQKGSDEHGYWKKAETEHGYSTERRN